MTWRFHEKEAFRANIKKNYLVISQTCAVKTAWSSLLGAMSNMKGALKMFGRKSVNPNNLRIVAKYWVRQKHSKILEPQRLSRHTKAADLVKIYVPGSLIDYKENEKVQALKMLRTRS